MRNDEFHESRLRLFSILTGIVSIALMWLYAVVLHQERALDYILEIRLILIILLVLIFVSSVVQRLSTYRFVSVVHLILIVSLLSLIRGQISLLYLLLGFYRYIENAIYEDQQAIISHSLIILGVLISHALFSLLNYEDLDVWQFAISVTSHFIISFCTVFVLYRTASYRIVILKFQDHIKRDRNTIKNLFTTNQGVLDYAGNVQTQAINKERKKLAREIHDSIGYTLTSVQVMMDAGRILLKEDPDKLDGIFTQIKEQSERTLDELHQILDTLRSFSDERRKGLSDIANLIRIFSGGTGILLDFNPGNVPWSFGTRIDSIAYRFIQQALTNALQHSYPDKIIVTFQKTEEQIKMVVWNNGNVPSLPIEEGIGISGMRERLSEIGGDLNYRSLADGFEVVGSFPYKVIR